MIFNRWNLTSRYVNAVCALYYCRCLCFGSVKLLGIALLGLHSGGVFARIGSEAELWGQKTSVEKAAYLEGFCHGVGAFSNSVGSKLNHLFCAPPGESGKSNPMRLCGKVHDDKGVPAVRYVDEFYRARNHSDIPIWAVVANHNDKACKENTVQGTLERMQKSNLCHRQLGYMMEAGVSAPVLQKQQEECDKYGNKR